MKLILAQPQGFCAGVTRAIEIVDKVLEVYGAPIYINHDIVHNKYLIENFKLKGVIFVKHIQDIPANSIVIFSAHGVSAKIEQEASERNLNIIDATCPLVTKVHLEAIRNEKDDKQILMIGHKNHPEVIGTTGRVSQNVQVIEKIEDIDLLEIANPHKLAFITQTTLSIDETSLIIEKLRAKFPYIIGPDLKDICYATQNRQEAVKSLIPLIDVLLVIGSSNSSNSNRLKDLGNSMGVPSFLVENENQILFNWFNEKKSIGITSGASAPQILVTNIVNFLQRMLSIDQIETLEGKKENIIFKLPSKLLDAKFVQ